MNQIDTMDSNIRYFKLIEIFLEKFASPDCQNEELQFIDEFLTHLETETASEDSSSLINHPVFSRWICQKVSAIYTKKTSSTPDLIKFFLRLTALLSKKEERFCTLNTNNFFYKLIKVSQVKSQQTISLGYITMLHSFLEHTAGVEWIMSSNSWEDSLTFAVKAQDVQIVDRSISFLSKMLQRAVDHDELFCQSVIVRILEVLSDNVGKISSMTQSGDNLVNLKSTMELIRKLLEELLQFEKNHQVSLLILKHFLDNERFAKFMVVRKIKSFNFEYSAIEFLIQFLQLYKSLQEKTIDLEKAKLACSGIMDNFYQHLRQESYEEVLKFCDFGQFYWKLFEEKVYEPYLGSKEELQFFANAMSLIPCLPFWNVICKYCPEKIDIFTDECIRDQFYEKVFKMCKMESIRLYYWWRDHLTNDNPYYFSFLGVQSLAKTYKWFPKSRGVFILQYLCYMLADTLDVIKIDVEILEDYKYKSDFFATTFHIIQRFIIEFDITWKDGFETINILELCFDFLNLNVGTNSVIVEILNLINLAITKYMAANLALLVDKISNSALALLGPILYAKVHDSDCKIKMAALKIICSISHISSKDFISLQEVIIETELPNLLLKLLDSNENDLVKTETIKCLQEMMANSNIWHSHLAATGLIRKILNKMQQSNKLVKIEAINFLTSAYKEQLILEQDLLVTFETMFSTTSRDFNWEIRKQSLYFWENVIIRQLEIQGMEDNDFPKHIFSTEHKKIISLTHAEIRNRLFKLVKELNAMGCLKMLMSTIQDDCDFDVTRKAIHILDKLLKLFQKYDFYSVVLKESFAIDLDEHQKNAIKEFFSFSKRNFEEVLEDKKKYYKESEEIFSLLTKTLPLEEMEIN